MGTLRLGEDLELDLRAYELRRAGTAVRLERLPMEILILLVQRRPDLVTREEIVEKVWGQGVFLDTDNSINVAIRKIRQALRDDPETPRFIRTVTAKGYRFIATVSGEGEAAAVVVAPVIVAPVVVAPPAPAAIPEATPAPGGPGPAPIVESRARSALRWTIPVAALALVTVGGLMFRWALGWAHPSPATHTSDGRLMLAVLPFENLTGDSGQDYFSDGFTEEMITTLGSLSPRRLGVIARTSVMYYKQNPAPLDRLGRDLGVQYVLEGSVRREADRVRITAQLIQVSDQTHLWAREYDRQQGDVLRVEEEIAQAIADQIESALGEAHPPAVRATVLPPREYEAHDDYLRGRYYWNLRTKEGFEKAVALFQSAIAKNADDARAYAGLADCYALMGSYSVAPQAEVIPRAREAALKALELDPGLAAAHTSLAMINEFFDWDWATAGDRFRKATEIDPNYVTGHHWYAEYLGFQGRFDEALEEIDRARRLDPLSRIIAADKGAILYNARQYDRAIALFRDILASEPGFRRAHLIACAYLLDRQFDAALEHLRAWQQAEDGPWPRAWLAYAYGRLGRLEDARRELEMIDRASPGWKQDRLVARATAQLGMGLNDEALASLQQACSGHSSLLVSLKVDPVYDPLRGDPRFAELLRCVHLAP